MNFRNSFRKYWLFTYRMLPTFFIGLAVYNVWLRYRKVQDISVEYKNEQGRFFSIMTNILFVASSDFSNEVKRIRRIVYQYTYKSNDFTTVSNFDKNSPLRSFRSDVNFPTNLIEINEDNARYFVCGDKCLLDLDGFYYGVGDDFGFGEIRFMSPRVVLTDRYRIKLKSHKPTVYIPSENRLQFAAMIDDTYPLVDYKPYADRLSDVEKYLGFDRLQDKRIERGDK